MVMARLAFLTKLQMGFPFLFPFTPSSSGDPMVAFAVVVGAYRRCEILRYGAGGRRRRFSDGR